MAGIVGAKDNSDGVVGVAPGARLWSIKVLDSSGNGFISDIIEGVDYVTAHADEIDVANLSFGGDGTNTALRTAIINSVSAGVTYAAAAGNDEKDASTVIPASYPEVMAVSAIVDTDGKCGGLSSPTSVGNDDTLADFSNFGSVVDIAAPGVLIKSTARGGSYTNSFSGTSASTPHVTGAAALYNSENPNATPSDIRNALRNSGSSPATICDGNGHGYFTGDQDNNAEPLLYIGTSSAVTGTYHYSPSFVLSGVNYQDVTSSPSLQLSQFSVAAWFKTSTNFVSDAFIANKGGVGSESSGQNLNYGIWMISTEQIRAGFETSTAADQYVTSVNTYNDNQWHYAVVTNDGSAVRLYIDGVQVATKSTAGGSPESSGTKPVRVGANSRVTPPGNFFTGNIDEVRVWNDDLTAQQVANAFAGSISTVGQILYLPFGSNSPPVANNQALNINKNTQQSIILTATDPNNNPLTYTVVQQPTHGTLTGTSPNLNYQPTTDYIGPDSFTFKANDGTVDSNTATVNINVQDTASCGTNLPISGVTASSNNGNVPANVLDNNLNTRWSNNPPLPAFITADLGTTQTICSVDIAWYLGDQRTNTFTISTSTDGTTFTNKFSGTSSGTTLNSEKYTFANTNARYVRITVTASPQTGNSFGSMTEVDIFGPSAASLSSTYNYGPSLTLSGPS